MHAAVIRIAKLLVGTSLVSSALIAQSAQVNVTPDNGSYPTGWQLAVHVQFCVTDPNEHFLNVGTVTLNGNLIASGEWTGAQGPCVDTRTADVTITAADGDNIVVASIDTYLGENVDVTYNWSQTKTYRAPADPPYVDVSIHNGQNRNVSMCAVACFNNVASYTTPAYMTLDAPRAATLFYSSAQVESRHIVEFNAANMAAINADQLTAKLRRPDGSYVTLTTGTTVATFTSPPSGIHRYAIQFEDSTLATGAYNYTLVIGTIYSGAVSESSVPIRVLVINERTSPYGAGWSVGGAGRVIVGPGDSVVTYDAAGTIQFWGAPTSCVSWTCTYGAPLGEFDQLKRVTNSGNPAEQWYYRTNVDGTKLTFYNFVGNRLISILDVWGNETRIRWRTNDPERIDSIIDPIGKAIVFGYDGSNRLASIRDVPGNRTTSITINAQNNLTQIQDPVGGKPFQQATYDSFHRLLSRVNRRGDRWASGYDLAGKLAADSTPSITADSTSSIANTSVYQPLVTLYRSTQAAGLSTVDSGGIGTITPPVGSVRKMRVDPFGALLEMVAPLSAYLYYVRNQHGQITESYDSAGHHFLTWSGPRLTSDYNMTTSKGVSFDWNTTTNRVTRRYGNGTVETKYFYDASGYRLDSTKTTTEPATRFTYDSRGRVLTITDPRGHISRSFYDGNAWSNTDSVKTGSRRSWFRYDAVAGRPSTVLSPEGRIDSTFYDVLNRVTRVGGPLGLSTSYAYGDSLNLTRITDALGHTSSVQKNAIGWDTLAVDQFNATQRYEYDRSGHLKRLTNRRGQLTRFVYDGIGRMTSRILADGRITNFSFGAMNSVVTNEEGADTLRWQGDTTWEIAVRNGTAYTVRTLNDTSAKDLVVRLSPVPLPPNNWLEVRYDLDSAGRVQRILPQAANPDTLSNVPDGLVTRLGWHGSFSLSLQTRVNHELARAIYSPSALQSSFGADYVQDTVGRTIQQVKGGGGEFENYSYDVRGRLTGFARYTASPTCAPGDTLSEYGSVCTTGTTLLNSDNFSYDAAGNRTDKNALVDAANRLRRFNGDSLLYDADGNLIRRYRLSDSSVFNQRLYWNSVGQLDSVATTRSGSTQIVQLGYDGFGRRVRKTVGTFVTYYVYSGIRVTAEYTGTATLIRAYAYQPGVDHPHAIYQGGAWHYYVQDGRGNVRGLINSTGTVVEAEYKYVPYGDSLATSGSLANSVRFGGREYDSETGLYYNRARYYDPTAGRFISEDAGSLVEGNRYAYAANNPINQNDPSGRACWWADGQQAQASAPVVSASTIVIGTGKGDIECDVDEGGAGSWSYWVEQQYWSQMYYDPLFENGGLPFLDMSPISVEGIGGCPDYWQRMPSKCAKMLAALNSLRRNENEHGLCKALGGIAGDFFERGRIFYDEHLQELLKNGQYGDDRGQALTWGGIMRLGPRAFEVGWLANTLAHEAAHFQHPERNHSYMWWAGNSCTDPRI